MKHYTKIDGQPAVLEGTREEIRAQCAAAGLADPFPAPADTRTPRQKAKDEFLSLPLEVRKPFLPVWGTLNNAIDNGDKEGALALLDDVAVPPELEAAKASIRTHLAAA